MMVVKDTEETCGFIARQHSSLVRCNTQLSDLDYSMVSVYSYISLTCCNDTQALPAVTLTRCETCIYCDTNTEQNSTNQNII